jgi:hypothetical protein
MLQRLISILLIAGTAVSGATAQQAMTATKSVKVSKGTVLQLQTNLPLDSSNARAGDDVPLRLTRPLVAHGVTLLPAGEIVHGRVVRVRRAKPGRRNGDVEWKLERIMFADSSTAQTEVYFAVADPKAAVPDRVDRAPGCGNGAAPMESWIARQEYRSS